MQQAHAKVTQPKPGAFQYIDRPAQMPDSSLKSLCTKGRKKSIRLDWRLHRYMNKKTREISFAQSAGAV